MKVGLEVHQQLSVGKLFCSCSGELAEEVTGEFVRRLYATQGETGATDPAARAQASRNLRYRYQTTPNSCLVEADEEPPHSLNPDALAVALTLAEMLGSEVVDQLWVMRKTVVDGSNTSGFQRTALVAIGGKITVKGRTVGISSICLEEDACRKIGEGDAETTYRLDRLGIPLLEIATEPDIRSGTEAHDVAEAIGNLLRATHRVKRGIGSIREDLNVSADGGSRVEIKGVQELRLISRYVDHEVARQDELLRIRDALREHGARVPDGPSVDLSPILRETSSRLVGDVLRHGGTVRGICLPGFGGLLGESKVPGERLGREMADHARARGVKGILHSDELPGYGVSAEETARIREALGARPAEDAFVLAASRDVHHADEALHAVAERARAALQEVPEETRDPLPDGRTRFSRPLPGRHRMYPETDVPAIPIPGTLREEVRRQLPEAPQVVQERLESTHHLNPEMARQILRADMVEAFEALIRKGLPVTLVARVLTQDLPQIESEAKRPLPEGNAPLVHWLEPALRAVEAGRFAKEGLSLVLRRQLLHGEDVETALKAVGLAPAPGDDLAQIVEEVLEANAPLIRDRGSSALSPLMGDVMARVRGKVDGRTVAALLKERLDRRLASSGPEEVPGA